MTGDLSNICKGHEKSGHNITADVSRVIFPFFYFKYLNAYLPCFKIKDFAREVTLGCIRFIIYHGIHFLYHRDPSCNANQARLIICKNTRVQTIVSIKRKPVLCYVSLKRLNKSEDFENSTFFILTLKQMFPCLLYTNKR